MDLLSRLRSLAISPPVTATAIHGKKRGPGPPRYAVGPRI